MDEEWNLSIKKEESTSREIPSMVKSDFVESSFGWLDDELTEIEEILEDEIDAGVSDSEEESVRQPARFRKNATQIHTVSCLAGIVLKECVCLWSLSIGCRKI